MKLALSPKFDVRSEQLPSDFNATVRPGFHIEVPTAARPTFIEIC